MKPNQPNSFISRPVVNRRSRNCQSQFLFIYLFKPSGWIFPTRSRCSQEQAPDPPRPWPKLRKWRSLSQRSDFLFIYLFIPQRSVCSWQTLVVRYKSPVISYKRLLYLEYPRTSAVMCGLWMENNIRASIQTLKQSDTGVRTSDSSATEVTESEEWAFSVPARGWIAVRSSTHSHG